MTNNNNSKITSINGFSLLSRDNVTDNRHKTSIRESSSFICNCDEDYSGNNCETYNGDGVDDSDIGEILHASVIDVFSFVVCGFFSLMLLY